MILSKKNLNKSVSNEGTVWSINTKIHTQKLWLLKSIFAQKWRLSFVWKSDNYIYIYIYIYMCVCVCVCVYVCACVCVFKWKGSQMISNLYLGWFVIVPCTCVQRVSGVLILFRRFCEFLHNKKRLHELFSSCLTPGLVSIVVPLNIFSCLFNESFCSFLSFYLWSM